MSRINFTIISIGALFLVGLAGIRYLISAPAPSICSPAPAISFILDEPLPAADELNPEILMAGDVAGTEYAVELYRFLPRRLDFNTADESLLQAIRGIGPSTATRILLERDNRGAFSDLDDLVDRTGIRPETVKAVERWIEIRNGKLPE